MYVHGLGFKLRVELAPQKPWMINEFDDLHERGFRIAAADHQPGINELFLIFIVELIAMPVPFRYLFGIICLHGSGTWSYGTPVGTQPHGASLSRNILLVREKFYHRIGGIRVKFNAVRVLYTAHVPGELNHRKLHAQTDTEERDLCQTGIFDGTDLSLHSAFAETTRNEHAVNIGEMP